MTIEKKKMFHKKINCIYNILCNRDLDKLVDFFYIKDAKTTRKNRKIYIKKKWLNKATYPRLFKREYKKYPFFEKITLNNKPIFKNADEFLEISYREFCEKIKEYVNQDISLKVDINIEYKYLYIYHTTALENCHIDYYSIEYRDNLNFKRINVEIEPPKSRKALKLKPYPGIFEYKNGNIVLTFENNNDYVFTLFNINLINSNVDYLVGVGIGISDINEKIPVAKKAILSKNIIEDVNQIYTIINETEVISAKENSYSLNYYDKNYYREHLIKYGEKIDNLNSLFRNLSQQKTFNNFNLQLIFREFSAINKIFKKVINNKSYYVNSRKRIWDILLDSYSYENYTHLYVVMPIYKEDNIFEYQYQEALDLQERLINLSHKVKMEFVFVLNDCKKPYFNHDFKNFLSKIDKSVKIYLALKDRIEESVNSIDFLFTNKKDFVISRFLRVDKAVFNIYNNKTTIDEHQTMYRKIVNRSVEYNREDNHKVCYSSHPVLQALIGEWYHYLYDPKIFLENRVIIYDDGTIEYFCQGVQTDFGNIEHKKQQSIITLEDIKNERLFTITFDNHPHKLQKAFLVKSTSKQYKKESDIFAIGIFSKDKIEESKAKEILGDINRVRLLESPDIYDRLSNYLLGKYGYS